MAKVKRRRIAVVITVLNEEKTIESLVNSLINQTIKPAEIIIVDGGSTDKTWEILKKKKGLLSFQISGNRSMGRNFGVSKAKSPIIAFTDAGCIPHPNWLEELMKPFIQNAEVVSGYYEGKAENVFQKCLIPFVLVMPDKLKGEFLPATRSMAIKKEIFLNVGGFDERLAHNEDFAFATKLRSRGFVPVFTRNAIVTWLPRQNLKSAAWMFLRFAIGDAQAGIFRPKVKFLIIRYYVFFFLSFINNDVLFFAIPYLVWAIIKNYKYVKDLRAIFWLPILQLTADIMVIFGTTVGLLSRL